MSVKSPLGWTLIGPTASFKGETEKNVNFISIKDDQLQQQLEMFWKTDISDSLADNKKSMSVEDQQALKIMKETAIQIDGHYQIALPCHKKPPCLPKHRQLAESRIRLLKKRLLTNEQVCLKYVVAVEG